MNLPTLKGRLRSVLLGGCTAVALALAVVSASAQVTLPPLVDGPTAVTRLQSYTVSQSNALTAATPGTSAYRVAKTASDFSLHVMEDIQLGLAPAEAIQQRLPSLFGTMSESESYAPAQDPKSPINDLGPNASGTVAELDHVILANVVRLLAQ